MAGPTATVRIGEAEVERRLVPKVPGGPAVAGDRVVLSDEGDDAAIVEVLPRATVLTRGDGAEGRPRAIVANADLLIVVAAVADPPLRPRLIDRYLVAGALGGLDCALAVTKTDLPHDPAGLAAALTPYRELGMAVVAGSAKDPAMVEEARGLIGGRTAILAGHSGVGKSTLTAALTGRPRATGAVSGKVRTGRHTTSDPRLIPMPGAGAVVDTAGVRTFHLPRLDRGELERGFPEIAAVAPRCRFRGCAHDGDAGCAVPGAVPAARLESYRRMLADLR